MADTDVSLRQTDQQAFPRGRILETPRAFAFGFNITLEPDHFDQDGTDRRSGSVENLSDDGASFGGLAANPSPPQLRPAKNPTNQTWTELFSETAPLRYLSWARNKRSEHRYNEMKYGGRMIGEDVERSVPLEITLYMVCCVVISE
jgi:hypothetical protein